MAVRNLFKTALLAIFKLVANADGHRVTIREVAQKRLWPTCAKPNIKHFCVSFRRLVLLDASRSNFWATLHSWLLSAPDPITPDSCYAGLRLDASRESERRTVVSSLPVFATATLLAKSPGDQHHRYRDPKPPRDDGPRTRHHEAHVDLDPKPEIKGLSNIRWFSCHRSFICCWVLSSIELAPHVS